MKLQINFLVRDLIASQLSYYLTKNLNDAQNINGIVFYENLVPPCLIPKFTTMNISEAWAQPGISIATTLSTAHKLVNFTGRAKKYFYVWDLEWLRGRNRVYTMYSPFFCNNELTLIARSEEHKKIIENNFNREIKIVCPDFNMDILARELTNG